jgi:hypothetical protein
MRVRSNLVRRARLPLRGGQDLRGFGSIADVLAALSSGAITQPEQLISSITLQTAYLPDITMNSPLAPSPDPSSVGPVMSALKPQITINFANNILDPMVIAPNGSPPATAWPYVEAGGVLLGLAVVGLSIAGVKYIREKRKKKT